MENQICERSEIDEFLDLGMVLGQNQAFGFLAGRCSAAQAEGIRRLRNEKLYKRVAEHWKDFCPRYLKMSGTHADRIIRLWEEFGAGYFEMAQLTRVSPETYRAIEPSVNNGALSVNGEQVELTIENARKVTAAVAEIRRSRTPKEPAPERPLATTERIERLEELCCSIVREFNEIPRDSEDNFKRFRQSLHHLIASLVRVRKDLGM